MAARGSDSTGGDTSFAAYQESLKRNNGGAPASASPSDVYQDQYGRTVQRGATDIPPQTLAPNLSMKNSRESHTPQLEQTDETANDSTGPLVSPTMEESVEPTFGGRVEQTAETANESVEPPLGGRKSAERDSSISTGREPPNDALPRKSLDYSVKFDTFPSQRVGHDRLQPVERVYPADKFQSTEARPNQIDPSTQSSSPRRYRATSEGSTSPSLADTASHRRAIEIMTLTDRMLAFPSERVGHDRLEPSRHGRTTPPTKEEVEASSSSSSTSASPRDHHRSPAHADQKYVVVNDPANVSSPFRFLGRPDPNFIIDELKVRGGTKDDDGNTDGADSSRSVAPDRLL